MPLLETSAICTVKIDGREIKNDISSVQLDEAVDSHHILQVRLRQVGKATSASDFDDPGGYTSFLGKSISLNIKPSGGLVDASRELEFIGTVTKVNIDNSIDGLNTVKITGHSPTISLDGPRHNAFYTDMKSSDIIGSIISKYPITRGSLEVTSRTHKFMVQYRETDYQFIMRLAAAAGKFAFYDGKEFRLVKASGSEAEELVWRETLGAFALGLGTASQEFTATVYNYEQKKEFTQDTKSLPAQSALSPMSKAAPDASSNIYSTSGFSLTPKFVPDAQTLDETLQTDRNQAQGSMIRSEGLSIVPKVAAGHCVKIKGMDKLDNTYWVKSVRHVFDESGKYHNTFDCTPLDIAFPSEKQEPPPYTELQSAVVTDNNDPDKLGRIKVKFCWQGTDTPWVRYLSPYAGKNRGWYALPEVGDEVLVGFDQGNPNMPVALGGLYNKDDAPDGSASNKDNDIKMMLTRGGSQIYFDDKDGKEQLKIVMKGGKNTLVMDLSGSKPKISIESQGDISLKGDNVSIEAQQKLEIKAGTDLNAQGINIKQNASGNMDIQGAMVNVKGTPIKLN